MKSFPLKSQKFKWREREIIHHTLNHINPGYAALQDVAIPLNQITFVAIYFALTAFAL